jgi:hypothetical protein
MANKRLIGSKKQKMTVIVSTSRKFVGHAKLNSILEALDPMAGGLIGQVFLCSRIQSNLRDPPTLRKSVPCGVTEQWT